MLAASLENARRVLTVSGAVLLSGGEIAYQPLYPELGLPICSPLAGGRLTDSTYLNPQGRAGDTIVYTVNELAGITYELVRSLLPLRGSLYMLLQLLASVPRQQQHTGSVSALFP